MSRVSLLILVLAGMVTTCAKKEIPPIPLGDDEKIVWVSPYFARVNGENCLQVQVAQQLTNDWRPLCKNIDDFEPKIGIQSKLLVRNFGNDLFRLKSILEEKSMVNPLLLQPWKLEAILSPEVAVAEAVAPTLVFTSDYRSVSGFDGCNNYRSDVLEFSEKTLIFGSLIRTKKACQNIGKIDEEFNWRLSNAFSYAIERSKLVLKDISGKTVLVFKKTT